MYRSGMQTGISALAIVSVVILLLAGGASAGAAEPAWGGPLLSNGGLELDANKDRVPDDWGLPPGASWQQESANHFLRLHASEPGKTVLVYRLVPIRPEYQTMRLTYRVRFRDIVRGKENWHDGRIMMNFKDDKDQILPASITVPAFQGSSQGWQTGKTQFPVPKGATKLEIMPTLFEASSGTLDVDELQVNAVSVPAGAAQTRQPAGKGQSQANGGQQRRQSPPPELRVVGKEVQTLDGKPVWLQGVNVPSLEWSTQGENVLKTIVLAIDTWKANIIRLPVRDDRWFGRASDQRDGGKAYRELVDQAIRETGSRGAHLLLDLHAFGAPTQASLEFWRDAATRYKNRPAVLFGLFNEAHDISWDVWRNGGMLPKDQQRKSDVIAENQEKMTTDRAVGMQQLVDAVRATGARNIVTVGGLDWAYDLSGILNGYALEDKSGNGIIYESHVYPWKSDWQGKFLAAAAKHPVLLGEVGADEKRMEFIPPERHEDPYTWSPDMLGCIQKYRLHWTGWCMHPSATPRMILDWNHTPTPFWGGFVRAALAGAKFEMNRAR